MKIDRLIGILSILLQRDKVTSQELAEKFEVSRRTILRDMETINIAGIPIVSEQGQGGGISIMDGYKIDHTLLSSDDMQAILSGLRSLDSVSGTNRYRQLMEKLSAEDRTSVNADNHIIIDLSSWDKSAITDKIELIKQAIEGILVAHNAVFDMSVLRSCLHSYGISWKSSADYLCTVQIGRRILPNMKHNLDVMCNHYGIALNHHQADSDSRACAEILLRYMESGVDVNKYVKKYWL